MLGFRSLLIHEPDCHHVIEYAQTEAFLRFENPMQVTASVTHPEFSGDSHDVIFTNVLNEAQRLNAWNDWNGLIPVMKRSEAFEPFDRTQRYLERLKLFPSYCCLLPNGCCLFD